MFHGMNNQVMILKNDNNKIFYISNNISFLFNVFIFKFLAIKNILTICKHYYDNFENW